MSLLLTMLPIYIFGNLHCMGMCGPLVMMIGHHRYRYCYFLGRLVSFTMTGMVAGEAGAVLYLFLKEYQIPALSSFIFAFVILTVGLYSLMGWQYPGYHWLSKRMASANRSLSLLMLQDKAWPAFLFGFFTILLPCGQTLVVFSACALSGSLWVGFINGFVFALLTSPALFLAMNAQAFLYKGKRYYNTLMGISSLFIGGLALCRGLAEMDLIQHWVLNPGASPQYHIVLF